jgi:hypothetical protein
MKHYVEVLDNLGYVSQVINMNSTDETIKYLSKNPKVKCRINGLDRCEWEFEFLPEYPTVWRD